MGADALRAALGAINEAVPPGSAPDALVVAAKVRGLMVGYDAHWSDDAWSLEGPPERTIELQIVNPETGRSSRTFRQAGKFDGITRGHGKLCLLEHKSTSDEIADPTATYWRRLTIDSQVSKYMLQAWQSGLQLDGCLYDVIRKPGIRPKTLTKADLGEISSHVTYCGQPILDEDYDSVIRGQTTESPALYAIRLGVETIENPDRYYQRRMVPRLDSEVVEYAGELWTMADAIREARVKGAWYRNADACMPWGSPCEYLPLCCGEDEPTSERWQRIANVHEELPSIEGGLDVLTNSRIKCFQLCRRKHLYRYELGLRRVREEEREATFLGSVLHEALAAWWITHSIKGAPHGHSDAERTSVDAIDERSEPAA